MRFCDCKISPEYCESAKKRITRLKHVDESEQCGDCKHWRIVSDITYTGVCENTNSKLFGKELLFKLHFPCGGYEHPSFKL